MEGNRKPRGLNSPFMAWLIATKLKQSDQLWPGDMQHIATPNYCPQAQRAAEL